MTKFEPVLDKSSSSLLSLSSSGMQFQRIVSCDAAFGVETFEASTQQLVRHPEYNSALILRSQVLSEDGFHPCSPSLVGYTRVAEIHRRLLPRRPERDAYLDQLCTFFAADSGDHAVPTLLILTPLIENTVPTSLNELPYYHPDVAHLAFLCVQSENSTHLHVEVVPLSPVTTKLERICTTLLSHIHRYRADYVQHAFHDLLVPREEYQDLYLLMRTRHQYLKEGWEDRMGTEAGKHVFEDIAIATYLILLWHHTFSSGPAPLSSLPTPTSPEALRLGIFIETNWVQPPNGFADLGCGNGLLTHILITEGFSGVGLDLRARDVQWSSYPLLTQSHLFVRALDLLEPNALELNSAESYAGAKGEGIVTIGEGTFIIGNHADELTPWLPILATIWNASGYLSIPCCSWAFDTRWTRGYTLDIPPPSTSSSSTPFTSQSLDDINLGLQDSKTTYGHYRVWLAELSLRCGWKVECDVLRIPSTRNWSVVGRTRCDGDQHQSGVEYARAVVRTVKTRGIFRPRRPEGRSH